MDQITQLYKSRAEDLQRKVYILEEQLKYLAEEEKTQSDESTKINIPEYVKKGFIVVPTIVDGKTVSRKLRNPKTGEEIVLDPEKDEPLPPEPPKPVGGDEPKTEPTTLDNILDYQFPGSQWLNVVGAPTSIRQSFKEHPYISSAVALGLLGTTEIPFTRVSPISAFKPLEVFTSYKQPVGLQQLTSKGIPSDLYTPTLGQLEAKPWLSKKSINPITLGSRLYAKYNIGKLGREGIEAAQKAEELRIAKENAAEMKTIASQAEDAAKAAEKIPSGDPTKRTPALIEKPGDPIPKTPLTDIGREQVEAEVRAKTGSIHDEVKKLIRTSDSLRTSAGTLPPESSPVGRVSGRGASAVAALEPPQMPKTPQEWIDAFKRGVQPDIEAAKMTGRDVGRVAGTLGRGALKTALTLGQATPEGAATTIASDIASGLGSGVEIASGIGMLPLAYLAYEQQAGGPDIDYSAGAKELERKYLERKAIRAMNPVTGVIDALQDIANKKREAEQLRQYEEEEKKKQKESSGMMDAMAKGMASYHP